MTQKTRLRKSLPKGRKSPLIHIVLLGLVSIETTIGKRETKGEEFRHNI